MANDWIKMRVDLADDPAVIGIAEATGLDEYAVVGRLHSAWAWADRHTTDGNAPSVTAAWLDRHVRAEGFAAAMAEVGWLEETPAGIAFPKFDRHNTQSGKQRALTAKRASRHRSKNNASSNAASVTRGAPREEKRREEKRREEEKKTSS